jgi:hypothetical protein
VVGLFLLVGSTLVVAAKVLSEQRLEGFLPSIISGLRESESSGAVAPVCIFHDYDPPAKVHKRMVSSRPHGHPHDVLDLEPVQAGLSA